MGKKIKKVKAEAKQRLVNADKIFSINDAEILEKKPIDVRPVKKK